jgi:hypothetical protein
MGNESIQGNLENFQFENYSGTHHHAGSFCKALKKIKPEGFSSSRDYMIDNYDLSRTWHGRYVNAIDGLNLTLPQQAFEELAKKVNDERVILNAEIKNTTPQTLAIHLYDVLNQVSKDIEFDIPIRIDERKISTKILRRATFQGKTLILCDRGYSGWYFMGILMKGFRNLDFLIRLPYSQNDNGVVNKFLQSGNYSQIVDIDIKKDKIELAKKLGFKINKQIKIRLLRVDQPNDKPIVLATSILTKKITVKEFAELYGLRWEIEKSHRYFKHNLFLENWHSNSFDGIRKEIYARQIVYNMAQQMALESNKIVLPERKGGKPRKYKRKANIVYTMTVVKRLLRVVQIKGDITNEEWENALLDIAKKRVSIRPNRNNIRKTKHPGKNHQPNYKSA